MINSPTVGERGLVASARAGDESAFDALVGPLIEPAFKLAAVMLRDREDAWDAVQEATIKAWQRLSSLRDESAVRQWFLAVVANQCRSMRRSQWFSVIRVGTISPSKPDARRGNEEIMDLQRVLASLPQTDRAVLFLHFYLDLPLAEVARVLGISSQAAKSRVHRAVTHLRLEMVEVKG